MRLILHSSRRDGAYQQQFHPQALELCSAGKISPRNAEPKPVCIKNTLAGEKKDIRAHISLPLDSNGQTRVSPKKVKIASTLAVAKGKM